MGKDLAPDINLLPGDELEKTPLGRFLQWALSYGRYIIVITELVVLLAFLSRFKLDRDISDLTDTIARKRNIIAASAAFETNVRDLQKRTEGIKPRLNVNNRIGKYLDLVSENLTSDAVATTIKIEENTLFLSGTVMSESSVVAMIDAFKKNQQVESVAVEKIAKEPGSNDLTFLISLKLWP